MKLWKVLILLIGFTLSANAFAEQPTYRVGIKEAKPFAYKEDGTWRGYSVDLLEKISKDVGFKYTFVEGKTVEDLILFAKTGKVDMSISAISTTDNRERIIDFSHPYFSTTQGIMIKRNGSTAWWVAKQVGIGILVLIVGLYVVGFAVSRLDTQDDIDNAHKGAWWALVTLTTVGYGDMVPGNAKGKVFAAVWMVASLFLLSIFTGYIASSLTVKNLQANPTTIQSLYSAKVVTLDGSTSSQTLTTLGITHKTVPDLSTAVKMLENHTATALVYDKAMLDFLVKGSDNSLEVWPINRGQERYAIAFTSGSSLKEDVNISILKLIDSPDWKAVTTTYFGNN